MNTEKFKLCCKSHKGTTEGTGVRVNDQRVLCRAWPLQLQHLGLLEIIVLFLNAFWDSLKFSVPHQDEAKTFSSAWGAVQERLPWGRTDAWDQPDHSPAGLSRVLGALLFWKGKGFPWLESSSERYVLQAVEVE